jgi:hypothetical protein
MIPTGSRALLAVTLLGAVPLSGALSASAATISTETAPQALPAPKLTGAVRQGVWGGKVTLTWTPSQSEQKDITYSIFAEGPSVPNRHAFVSSLTNETTATFIADGCGGSCPLPGTEVYTVVASDRTKAESPPSNGMVAPPR